MNNTPRIFVWAAFAIVIYLNYQAWMVDYGPRPGLNTVAGQSTPGSPNPSGGADLSSKIPQASAQAEPGAAAATDSATAGVAPAEAAGATATTAAAEVIHVRTDVLDVEISTLGGTIKQADLLKYTQVKGEASLVRLENEDSPVSTYLLQSGLTGPGKGPYPTQKVIWSAARNVL